MNRNRRQFLAGAGLVPLALTVAWSARAQAPACYDPAKLSLADRNSRRSVDFREVSPDPAKRCGLCAFFDGRQGNCGACKLFNGMPVTAGSVCDSFASKQG